MGLTIWKQLAKKLQMDLFATGVAGNLRVVLTHLSFQGAAGPNESFFLGFFEEDDAAGLAYANHLEVPGAIARSVVGAQTPATAQENEDTLDAVITDPVIFGLIQAMANGFPLLQNLTNQVVASNVKTILNQATPQAPPAPEVKSWDKSGGAI